jgi:hypothetical protein
VISSTCNSEFDSSFSLTPNFSWVGESRIDRYRFNGFVGSWTL